METAKKISKIEELETITTEQEAIIGNEGIMRFVYTALKINPLTNKLEEVGIFLSEITLDNGEIAYKKVRLKPDILPLDYSTEIIGKENKMEYILCQRRWGRA